MSENRGGRGVTWHGVAWRGVGIAWPGVAWRSVARRGVAWRGVARRSAYICLSEPHEAITGSFGWNATSLTLPACPGRW